MPQHLFTREAAELYPTGNRNLGIAHGIPGAIALLASGLLKGLKSDQTRTLLADSVQWLVARQQNAAEGSRYSHVAESPGKCRCAWCYGDLGVAMAIHMAGRALCDERVTSAGLSLAKECSSRAVVSFGVDDAALCHGAAGIAHMFNELYHGTGESCFQDAAREWIGRTLDFRRDGEGIAGFWSFEGKTRIRVPDPGFLTGASGIGLALIAAVDDEPPNWDETMLLSVNRKQ